ncbi:MAG: hypothetical protein KC996_08875 [Phycisphaerales bacterium]|nr:hypothetical protein [Phycisphaerales bacterium]
MPFLKLHSYEPETEPPAPLPFSPANDSWRSAGRAPDTEGERMDSIAHAEQALAGMQNALDALNEQVDEHFEPIKLSRWMDTEDDDGPWAA